MIRPFVTIYPFAGNYVILLLIIPSFIEIGLNNSEKNPAGTIFGDINKTESKKLLAWIMRGGNEAVNSFN